MRKPVNYMRSAIFLLVLWQVYKTVEFYCNIAMVMYSLKYAEVILYIQRIILFTKMSCYTTKKRYDLKMSNS